MESKPLVPTLRFSEFRDAPWDVLNGNHLFDTVDRRPAPLGLPVLAITQEQGAISRDDIDYHVSVTAASIASYKEVRPADFIISLRSFQGGIEYSRVHGICSPAYVLLKRKGDGSDDFYRQLFKSPRFIQQITRNIEGLRDGKMISYKQFSEQLLPAPSPPEQQKIAECLTSLDELIAAEGRKLEALRAHKKGLMQNLFPREGETIPRLRFPEFRDSGKWVEKRLGDFADVLMCKRIFASETNPTVGVPFYKIGTLGGTPDAYISEDLLRSYRSLYKFPRKGEVLITCSGTIGKCLPYDGADAYYQDSNIVWLDNPSRAVTNELLYLILSAVDWGKLNSTTITRIYGSDLRSLSIRFPENEPEQKRIADCITSLDALVTAQMTKIETLKLHKQGLMQGLFPSPEVRLT